MDERVLMQDFSDKIVELVERILACCDGLDEAGINWKPDAPETNSIYVLATHTMGNVRQNTLAILGGEEDRRDRDAEFVASGDSAADLQRQWAELKPQVQQTLGRLGEEDLARVHSHPRRGRRPASRCSCSWQPTPPSTPASGADAGSAAGAGVGEPHPPPLSRGRGEIAEEDGVAFSLNGKTAIVGWRSRMSWDGCRTSRRSCCTPRRRATRSPTRG